MKVTCNFCDITATGTKDELMDKGWARAVIYAPVRKTITTCQNHYKEFNEMVMGTLKSGQRDKKLKTREQKVPLPEGQLTF